MEGARKAIPINIEDEVRQSFMDYAMSVIISRALPDARDGLKPVHRRVLYGMHELGNEWNRAYKKSARVVGDVMGKYHPHGDTAIYDTIVRMAQDFSLRHPLVDGQGNFGSIDGDPPAAMRYTEVRMARIAVEMLADIDKETVNFLANYDETTHEPAVLPARLPNLLVNGSAGIAVGMATNVPPHNLGEIVDAVIAVIQRPDITLEELMEIVPGPDFPTAGFIHGREAIRQAYTTGKGILTLRARATTEDDDKRGRTSIIVTEIPYQVNKTRLIERIAELANEKKIDGIADLRDESDRDGMRIVIELKKDGNPDIVLNQLYKQTPMQESFGVIMLAIVNGQPKLLDLKEAVQVFIAHRKDVITKRTIFELRKAEERLHILDGLKIALDNIDAVIALIRQAKDPSTAKEQLVQRFGLSEIQAQAILEMRLQRLTGLEREKILEERDETLKKIARFREILGDETEVYKIIVEESLEIRKLHANERRTQIVDASTELSIEDLIVEEDMVVTLSHEGYIKRNAVTQYRAQRRGGRGKIGATTKEEDFVEHLFVASTHAYILFFTTSGRVYWRKVHEIPQAGRAARGRSVTNVLNLEPEERLSAFLPVREFQSDRNILFATRRGLVKKTELMQYANPRPSGIIAIALEDNDSVIGVRLTDGQGQVILSTRNGQSIRFKETDARPMGRSTYGVVGMRLDEGDEVVSLDMAEPGATLLAVSELGYGKRTHVDEYRLTRRGGKGIITMRITEKNGPVVGVRRVADDEDIMLITNGGKVIRTPVTGISVMGRATQGVRLFDLNEGEKVVGVARLAEMEEEDNEPSAPAET